MPGFAEIIAEVFYLVKKHILYKFQTNLTDWGLLKKIKILKYHER